jgi:hypothetical protein
MLLRRCCEWGSGKAQKDDIHTAIAGAALFGCVGGDGVELRVACERERGWIDETALKQDTSYGCGARGGEFPIGTEGGAVDGDVVGVSFNTDGRWEDCGRCG